MGGLRIDGSVVEAKWWCYFGLVILAGILIRAILSGLREWELRCPPNDDVDLLWSKPTLPRGWWRKPKLPKEWWWSWCKGFLSTHKSALVKDYWHPFFLGFLELSAYPYFIATGNWKVIGGWIAVKTAAQWRQ